MPADHDTSRPQRRWHRWLPAAAIAVALAAAGATMTQPQPDPPEDISLSAMLDDAADGRWDTAVVDEGTSTVTVTGPDGDDFTSGFTLGTSDVITERLLDSGVDVELEPAPRGDGLADKLWGVVPFLLLVGVLLWVARGQSGGLGRFLNSKVVQAETPDVRFSDVAGVDEVVDELFDIADYLRDPADWHKVGARPPKGILLSGPPGTGKTLLAKAMAGEAGVPFFDMTGSGFVEMFVGVGARRVTRVFEEAGKHEAAIIFIDEIDAIGKARTAGANAGANEERENTLNQLLSEIDGFNAQSNVIVIGATNRPDILDSALTREGRFDRKIVVPPPDRAGRMHILRVHAASRPVADDVDLDLLATRTMSYTGAQLASLVAEAAREAARERSPELRQHHFDAAVATTALGRERRSMEVLEQDRQVTAWHEAGHTVAALLLDAVPDPLQVSIVPRGASGGHTSLTGDDRVFMTRTAALQQLQVAMGGRAAEVLAFGDDYTQGAAHDVKAATQFATRMAAEYGMSTLGLVHVPEEQRTVGPLAERLADVVADTTAQAYQDVLRLLEDNRPLVEAVTDHLLEHETADRSQLRALRGAHAAGS